MRDAVNRIEEKLDQHIQWHLDHKGVQIMFCNPFANDKFRAALYAVFSSWA